MCNREELSVNHGGKY